MLVVLFYTNNARAFVEVYISQISFHDLKFSTFYDHKLFTCFSLLEYVLASILYFSNLEKFFQVKEFFNLPLLKKADLP